MKIIPCFLIFLTTLFAINSEVQLAPSYEQENLTAQNITVSSPDFSSKDLVFNSPHLVEPERKSVAWAVTLSGTFPGLGQIYLGDVQKASWQTGSGVLAGGLIFVKNSNIAVPGLFTFSNLSRYSVYSAYRDARIYNHNHGYQYKMPTDSFASLLTAPFSPSIMKKREVWGGILGFLALGTAVQYAFSPNTSTSVSPKEIPFMAFPVAIGEESYFRGFLQPVLSEYTSPKTGIYLSALAFGAAHIPNAFQLEPEDQADYYLFSLPVITAFGVYAGWLTQKTLSLREAVAIHAWYDFAIFSLNLLAPKTKATKEQCYAFSIPF